MAKQRHRWSAERRSLRGMVDRRDGRLLVAAGVGSGADARVLHHAISDMEEAGRIPDYVGGFITFVSGYLCAAAHGLPDLGYVLRDEIVRQTDVVEQATWLTALDRGNTPYPIGVDIDTGYGNEPSAVVLSCRQAHKQGAAYVQIEDQHGINKSCGHMAGARGAGKHVVDEGEMVSSRLAPALDYASNQDDFLVAARTDALATLGVDEALRRARAYVDAGADLIFVEAPQGRAQLARIASELDGCGALNIANMVEGSDRTPYVSPRELHDLGFDVALYPVGAFLAGHEASARYYAALAAGEPARAAPTDPGSFERFNRAIGAKQAESWNGLFDE